MIIYDNDSTNTYYAITDHLGTVHALADASGAVAESYEFDAWGNVLAIHDASGSPISNQQSAIGNRYLFQGREYSYATGLYHFRMRWYDPTTGRWLSNDPIGIGGGLNQYVFCDNSPITAMDPDGLTTYFLNDGGSHANLIVADPRSKTGYTWYGFRGMDAGWDGIAEMWNSLKTKGIMTKMDFPLDALSSRDGLVQLDTTQKEEECIRKQEDAIVASPGIYSSPFRNCATVHRQVLFDAGYLASPNTIGWIYTPNGVAHELEARNQRRLLRWGVRDTFQRKWGK